MPHRILLTCFGSKIAREVVMDFERRNDMEVFVADADPHAPISLVTKHFLHLPRGDDPFFPDTLFSAVKKYGIEMVIPGGDEDAFALMRHASLFADTGVLLAVSDSSLLSFFTSKSAQYEYLKQKGFSVPSYQCVRGVQEFENALRALGYPDRSLLLKPNVGRGGEGIFLLSEQPIPNRDNLPLLNRELARQIVGEEHEWMIMEYLDGIIYDVDVLRYRDGSVFFGARKRLVTNITKLFSGNTFEQHPALDAFCRKLYDVLPTSYLIDYDILMTPDGRLHLLEVNPRPSGSTISYIPFGVNLYYVLAKSYLDNEYVDIPSHIYGHSAFTFYTMVRDTRV